MDGIVYYCRIQTESKEETDARVGQMLEDGFLKFFQTKFCRESVKKGRFGKPFYADGKEMQFNISHCRGGAAVALSRFPVGVDMECMRKVLPLTVKKCCNGEETVYVYGKEEARGDEDCLSDTQAERFLKLWTLKESYVKMTGEGLQRPLTDVCFPQIGAGKRIGQNIWEIDGEKKGQSRHYLSFRDPFILALSVNPKDNAALLEFEWKEYRFASNGYLETTS